MDEVTMIKGLEVVKEFVSIETEKLIVNELDSNNGWRPNVFYRVQYFGQEIDYSTQQIYPCSMTMTASSFLPRGDYNQCTVMELWPSQSTGFQLNSSKTWGEKICILVLGSDTEIEFNKHLPAADHEIPTRKFSLPQRSVLVLTGEARYQWKHRFPPKKDNLGQERRLIMTFRHYN
jgi:hypothetical protein